jgi:hypothetical protein
LAGTVTCSHTHSVHPEAELFRGNFPPPEFFDIFDVRIAIGNRLKTGFGILPPLPEPVVACHPRAALLQSCPFFKTHRFSFFSEDGNRFQI